jgi:hypothetical protein
MTTDLIKRLTEAGEKIRQYAGHADRPLRTIEEIALRSAALHDEAAALLRAQQAKPVVDDAMKQRFLSKCSINARYAFAFSDMLGKALTAALSTGE